MRGPAVALSCPLSWKMSTHLGICPREPNHSRLIQEAITVHSPISRPQPIIPQWIQTHRPILEIHYENLNPILLSMAIHGPRRRETTRARDHYPMKNLTSSIYLIPLGECNGEEFRSRIDVYSNHRSWSSSIGSYRYSYCCCNQGSCAKYATIKIDRKSFELSLVVNVRNSNVTTV